jgi:hypothetical protein
MQISKVEALMLIKVFRRKKQIINIQTASSIGLRSFPAGQAARFP